MSLPTRRQLLHASGAALLTGLAGCSGANGSASFGSESNSGETSPHGPDPDTLVTDYDRHTIRHEADEAIFRSADANADDDDIDEFVLTTNEDRKNLDIVATPAGIDDARAFIDETNFQDEGLAIVQHRVDACRKIKLLYVASPPDEFARFRFCTVIRDASVECSTDAMHVVASIIRVPNSDSDETSWGYSRGSSCRLPPSLQTETADEDEVGVADEDEVEAADATGTADEESTADEDEAADEEET
ncbi:hypothetical protein [Haloferax mucosum]|nr:hypothetical protein [Haloferax mucosum]